MSAGGIVLVIIIILIVLFTPLRQMSFLVAVCLEAGAAGIAAEVRGVAGVAASEVVAADLEDSVVAVRAVAEPAAAGSAE